MKLALDHVVAICDPGAPQADALRDLGLLEGSSNVHDGQGTANRRFFFHNAYLELLWVDDLGLSRREPSFRTRLWERWVRRRDGACPLGVALRPADPADAERTPPFPMWAYHPPYLASNVSIGIALNTPLTEAEFLYMNFATSPVSKDREPLSHPLGVNEITQVRIGSPNGTPRSPAFRAAKNSGIVAYDSTKDYVAEIVFDGAMQQKSADLRPGLPLLLRW